MTDNNDFGAFVIGFLVGGLAGAVTALLLAPQSGEDTRTMVKSKAIELRDQAEKTAEETMSKAGEIASDTGARVQEVATTTRRKVGEQLRRGQVMLEEAVRKPGDSKSGDDFPATE